MPLHAVPRAMPGDNASLLLKIRKLSEAQKQIQSKKEQLGFMLDDLSKRDEFFKEDLLDIRAIGDVRAELDAAAVSLDAAQQAFKEDLPADFIEIMRKGKPLHISDSENAETWLLRIGEANQSLASPRLNFVAERADNV